MTATSRDSKAAGPLLPFGDAFADISKLLMLAPHMQATALKGLVAQQREMFDFLKRRCDADSRFLDQLGTASTMMDVGSACYDFWRDAASQYATETKVLTECASQGIMESVQTTQQEISKDMPDALRAAA